MNWVLLAFAISGPPTVIDHFPDKGSCLVASGNLLIKDDMRLLAILEAHKSIVSEQIIRYECVSMEG